MKVRIAAFSNQENRTGDPGESLRFMKNASAAEWATLFSCTRDVHFEPGDVLLRTGDMDRSMYIVLAGQLEIVIGEEESETRVISQVDAGAIFGEQSFLDGLPRSGTIRAITSGEARVLDWYAYEKLAVQEPKLGQEILRDIAYTLSLRLRKTSRLLV